MEARVVRIQMVRERSIQYESAMRFSLECYGVLKEIFDGMDREAFVVVCLDSKNRINAVNVVSVGTLNGSLVHPREVFKAAILSNSASIILAHNHPGGDPTPSREDEEITQRIIAAGKILGITVSDCLIVGDDRYLSMADKGWAWGSMLDKPAAFKDTKPSPPIDIDEGRRRIFEALQEADSETVGDVYGVLLALKAERAKKKTAGGRK